jgi:hypothetical protein
MAAVANLFERLDEGRQAPATNETAEQEKSQSVERLLSWLINNWRGDTITARQIRLHGPYPCRREPTMILDLAQELCQRGWLLPIVKPRRHDTREWKIGRASHTP